MKEFLDNLSEPFCSFFEVQKSASDFIQAVSKKAVGLVAVLFLLHWLDALLFPDANFEATSKSQANKSKQFFQLHELVQVRVFQVEAPLFKALEKHLNAPALAVDIQGFSDLGIGQHQQVFFFFVFLVPNQFGSQMKLKPVDSNVAVQTFFTGQR